MDYIQVFIFFLVTATLAVGLFAVPSAIGKLLEDFANLRGYKEGLLFHGHYGMCGRQRIANTGREGDRGSENKFDTSSSLLPLLVFSLLLGLIYGWIAIPEPPKARVRDVERLGSMSGENEADGGVLVEAPEAHQRASAANPNVARVMGREACEGFVI